MPIKFGSSLVSKLNKVDAQGKRYWEREDTAGKPFVLAIADFHKRADQDSLGSMTFTHSALWPYLYGHRVEWEMVDGELVVRPIKNQSHKSEEKNIPSGFFGQPGAENVSAVLFSNGGTVAKFEGWSDGLQLFHNPNAKDSTGSRLAQRPRAVLLR